MPVLEIGNDDRSRRVDLLNGPMRLRAYAWGLENGPSMALPMLGQKRGDPEGLARPMIELERLLADANRYRDDPLYHDPVWLYRRSDGDQKMLRRFVTGYQSSIYPNRSFMEPLTLSQGLQAEHVITLQEAAEGDTKWPAWEDAEEKTETGLHLINFSGAGTLPGRITELTLESLLYSSDATQVMVGIRPVYEGAEWFAPTWNLENGLPDNGYTLGSQAGSNGSQVVVSDLSASADFHGLVLIRPDHITQLSNNWTDMRGRYLVLIGYQFAGTSDRAWLRLRSGYWSNPSNAVQVSTPLPIQSTGGVWKGLTAGVVTFPTGGDRHDMSSNNIRYQTIGVEGKRASGTANLYLDFIQFVPLQHFVRVTNTVINSTYKLRIRTYPDGTVRAYTVDTSNNHYESLVQAENWWLPRTDSLLVVAQMGNNNVIDMANGFNVTAKYVERWRGFQRGV